MQITSTSTPTIQTEQKSSPIQPLYTEKISQDDVKAIKESIFQQSKEMIEKSTLTQSALGSDTKSDFTKAQEDFQSFLDDIGYTGQSLDQISQEQAKELVSEDGFFGVQQTSQRMSDFVIDGADGDESLLRAGRDGILQGYEDAKEQWGGELPEISQKTLDSSLENVDMKMNELGYSILDTEV
jgi:hypothetical protein